jgi:hypothetical protein
MLMGKGSGCTGLLHTRSFTDTDGPQAMNFVTLSQSPAKGH